MMTTKLEIIGPYTPDHPGPFAWIRGYPKKCLVHSVVEGVAFITADGHEKPFSTLVCFIRNAREVRVPREFWINESYNSKYVLFEDKSNAILSSDYQENHKRTIHVREVLEGE